MGNSNNYRMSAKDQEALWDLWHSGFSLYKISDAINIMAPSVFCFLRSTAAIDPGPGFVDRMR